MHEKIRRVTNRRKTTQYADDRVTRPEMNDESGPSITSAEVKHAIKKLKNNKATGTYLIAAEMLKALGDGPIEKLTQLCN